MKILYKTSLVISAVLVFQGCGASRSTTRREPSREAMATTGALTEVFTPSSYIARPTLGVGSRYQNLLSPNSYVIWVTDEVAQLKLESETAEGTVSGESEEVLKIAQALNERYLIMECHIESAFQDSSIAYDITSFRQAEVFLLDDAGNRCEPLQVIVGALERGRKDALPIFTRVNILVFPKHDLLTGELLISPRTREFSLVIAGYNTTYFFSWNDLSRPARAAQIEREAQAIRAVGLGKLESALRFLVENLK